MVLEGARATVVVVAGTTVSVTARAAVVIATRTTVVAVAVTAGDAGHGLHPHGGDVPHAPRSLPASE